MAANVKYIAPQVQQSIPLWKTIDDVSDGIIGITRNPEVYLIKEDGETQKSYDSRLQKATWIDAFNDTIDGLSGLVFKKPIVYNDDIPTQLNASIENADMQGNHFDIIIQNLFDTALRKGIGFFLVDMPKGQAKNRAEEIQQNIRPYYTIIQPENVTSWKTETRQGQIVLTQVKIREFTEKDVQGNEYATEPVERYRILEIGKFKVINVDKDDVETIEDEGDTGLDFIPFGGLNLNVEGYFVTKPPFYDLAKLNIGHYQIFTDSRHSAHIASVPMLKLLGFQDDEAKSMVISANKAIRSTASEAKVEWLDYDGGGVAVNESLMNKLEEKMNDMGLSVITGTKELTATEVNISTTQKQSKLNTYVRALKDSVELMLQMGARFYNKSTGGTVSFDADILKIPLTAEEVRIYSDMIAKGQLSNKTLWLMLLADRKLPEDFDPEVEETNLETDGLLSGNPRTTAQ